MLLYKHKINRKNATTKGGDYMINVPKLRGKIAENEMSISDLAGKIGISKSTLYQKINNNGVSFTIDEVVSISQVLKLSKEEFNNIFFADFVA